MIADRLLGARWTPVLLALLVAAPLLLAPFPPLVDLPGHMGRFAIAQGGSPSLAAYFDYHWALIPNLGVDIAVWPLAKLLGVEMATKIVVTAIPAVTAFGMLASVRAAQGRIPPTALFALPLAISYPFLWGFVNFCLSMALALCALALWMRMEGTRRALWFVPVSWILWISHSFGWGAFGLMAFGTELGRRRDSGETWIDSVWRSIIACLTLTTPVIAMVLHHDARGMLARRWFEWPQKALWVTSILRDHWQAYDIWCAAIVLSLPVIALTLTIGSWLRGRKQRYFSSPLLYAASLSMMAFVLLPQKLMDGNYVDMRLAPFAAALAVMAIDTRNLPQWLQRGTLAAGASFMTIRLIAVGSSVLSHGAIQQQTLAALDQLPVGARVLSLVDAPCLDQWDSPRWVHFPAMAIVRRQAFTNEQWAIAGQQLNTVRLQGVAPDDRDPSQLVYRECFDRGTKLDLALARFNDRVFTHVWTIGFGPDRVHDPRLKLVWSDPQSALYKVEPR